jgi:hypothetical protein
MNFNEDSDDDLLENNSWWDNISENSDTATDPGLYDSEEDEFEEYEDIAAEETGFEETEKRAETCSAARPGSSQPKLAHVLLRQHARRLRRGHGRLGQGCRHARTVAHLHVVQGLREVARRQRRGE